MRIKKTLVILTACLIVGAFFVGAASADQWYYNYTIAKVGVNSTGAVVEITNGTTSAQKILLEADENELLAIALTAQSNGSTVHVHFVSGSNRFDSIQILD